MFVHRSSAYCQQLGPPEPTLRTTTFCEDQFLHHNPGAENGLFLSRRVFHKATNKDRTPASHGATARTLSHAILRRASSHR